MPGVRDKLLIFEDFLKEEGLRKSRQREIIAREFFRSDKHMAVDELLMRSRTYDSNIGFATVYRTLKLLVDCNLAHERDFNTGRKLYEQSEEGENHDHLVCLECGRVQEFRAKELRTIQEKIADRFDFVAKSYRHELYGVCKAYETTGACPHKKRTN